MTTTIFGLAGGVVFILLGRWIYVNPKALYVSSLHKSTDSPSLKLAAKVFGTLAIFVGSYAAVVAIADLVIRQAAVAVVLGLSLAALSTRFLRPTVKPVPSPGMAQRSGAPSRARLLVAVMLGFGAFFTATVLILIKLGDGRFIPLASAIAALTSAAAVAAILWLPKRVP